MSRRTKDPKLSRKQKEDRDVDRKEKDLTELIFGRLGCPLGGVVGGDKSEGDRNPIEENNKFLISSKGKRSLAVGADETGKSNDSTVAWRDEDDASVVVSAESGHRLKKLRDSREVANWNTNELEKRLRERYEKTANKTSRTNWAAIDHVDANRELHPPDDDDNVVSKSSALFSRTTDSLRPNVIEMVRLKDVNAMDPGGAVLRTVRFHPESDPDAPLLMTAGLDKSVRFYSIGQDEETRKVHGIHCKSSYGRSGFIFHGSPSHHRNPQSQSSPSTRHPFSQTLTR
jgi:hypothetical protein